MVTAGRSEAGGTRESGGATRLRISGGAEGGRSQGGTNRSTGQGGAKGTVAGGVAEGSSRLGEVGECLALGLTTLQGVTGEGEGLQESN